MTYRLCLNSIFCWEAGLACQALGKSTSYSCRGGKGVGRRKGHLAKAGSAHPFVSAPASVPLAVASFCPRTTLPGSDQLAITAGEVSSPEEPKPCGSYLCLFQLGEALLMLSFRRAAGSTHPWGHSVTAQLG